MKREDLKPGVLLSDGVFTWELEEPHPSGDGFLAHIKERPEHRGHIMERELRELLHTYQPKVAPAKTDLSDDGLSLLAIKLIATIKAARENPAVEIVMELRNLRDEAIKQERERARWDY